MRRLFVVMTTLFLLASPLAAHAHTDFSLGLALPGISIGINQPAYPDLAPIPGYPVYYAQNSPYNYFFYDGLFWVFIGDAWYSSSWYDGPWSLADPLYVPAFILRVPVRYFLAAPFYFAAWALDFAPHWGDHWGHDWEYRRRGWDHWDRHADWRRAPRPDYQRRYAGNRYPRRLEQQRQIRDHDYAYQPRETLSRRHLALERGAERRVADRGRDGRDRRDPRIAAREPNRAGHANRAARTPPDTRIADNGRNDRRGSSARRPAPRDPAPSDRRAGSSHRAAPRDLALNDRRAGSSHRVAPAPHQEQHDRYPARQPQKSDGKQGDRNRSGTQAQRSAPRYAERDQRAHRSAPQRDSRIARAEPRIKRQAPAPSHQRQPQRSHERASPQQRSHERAAPQERSESNSKEKRRRTDARGDWQRRPQYSA